jgi:uncharacterized membrane protein
MNTKEMNINEWNNANNWSRMGLFGVYFSKNDSRAIVPKATPAFGWTLNFGHRFSVLSLAALIVLPVISLIIALALQHRI